MSRYTASEIKCLSKATLIELVRSQPEVVFPARICSRPVERMDKRHLIRGLTGNYGYTKLSVAQESSSIGEALPDSQSGSTETVGTDPLQQDNVRVVITFPEADNVCLQSDAPLVELTPLSNSSLEGDRDIAYDTQSYLNEEYDTNGIEDETMHPVEDLSPMGFASGMSFSPATVEEESLSPLVSSPPTPPTTPSTASSPSPSLHTGHLTDWYDDENTASDEDLLEAYFLQNPKLLEQVSRHKTHKRKRQTDTQIVRDYKFALEVFKLLVENKWENGARVKGESIMKYLGHSAPWFSKARRVMELLEKIGPDSPNPDPLVLQRFSAEIVTGKGQEILTFLQARAKAASN